ncbi:MAG: hypothetical protein K6T31_08800 [Alicyclobacillus sp.]|nr:hypothetical protein [Alicyclobacillus sp.]
MPSTVAMRPSGYVSATSREGPLSTSAVVFLTIFLLMWGLFPDDFLEKAKPALLTFRISQILLAVFVMIPEKEQSANQTR